MPAAAVTSDEDLIPGLIARDEGAIELLLERYWSRAYQVAVRLTGDPAGAEDATQETFVRVLDRAEQFEPGRAFRPWFFKILLNTARKQHRSASRRRTHEERAAKAEPLSPDAGAESAEATSLVRSHLADLNPKLQVALSLRYLEEMSLGEVAEALGIPQGTVSSRIRRGLESLRESLSPALQLGATGGVEWLRLALEAPAPSAPGVGELLAGLLDAPIGPVGVEGLPLNAPQAPSPGDLITLAKGGGAKAAKGAAIGAATAAAKTEGVSRGPLAAMAALLLAGVATSALLLPEPNPVPSLAGASSPRLSPPIATVGTPTLEFVLPAQLTVGDELEAELVVRWPGGDPGQLVPEVSNSAPAVLELGSGGPRHVGDGGVRFFLPFTACSPGTVTLIARVGVPDREPLEAERTVRVIPAGRAVRLLTNVEIQGPEAEVRVRLPDEAGELQAPRRLDLHLLPGLVAEAELSLRGFARLPTGCFEQTTAATYPSALVLELATQDDEVDPGVREQAHRHAVAGAERLRRFQHSDGGFSLHPGRATRIWLTAVGLNQLVQLSRVVPVDASRIRAASLALLRWQRPDGHFEPGAADHVSPRRLTAVAVTAYALSALSHEGLAVDADALARGFEWLGKKVATPASRGSYELALAGKAFLAAGDEAQAGSIAEALVARANGHGDGRVSWDLDAGESSFTGTRGEVATAELTGLVVQVLAQTGHQDLATGGLAWLAAARTEHGFGGTQATIQALEAFRLAGELGAAKGVLEVSLGRSPLPVVEVAPSQGLVELALGQDVEAAIAIEHGVSLRYLGSGRLRGQLVLSGQVPWDAPGWSGGELTVSSDTLVVRVTRPRTARVGELQRWKIRVGNRGESALSAPMVEISLPPGFVLGDDDGGLATLLEASGSPLLHYEILAGTLVLYVRDLGPSQAVFVQVGLLPTLAGRFAGGALWAYPYYQREPGQEARGAPGQVRVLPPRRERSGSDVELTPPPREPSPEPEPVVDEPLEPGQPSPASSEPEAAAADGTIRIAWDAELGPLSPAMLDLPHGNGPLEQLLGRALLRGLPSLSRHDEIKRDQVVVFELLRGTWSDGSPVTIDDYLVTWEEARGLLEPGLRGSAYTRVEARILRDMKIQVLGARRLRLSLPEPAPGLLHRLDRWPFLPRPQLPASGLMTNGAWRIAQAERGRLVLEGAGPRVVIEEVGERPRSGFHLAWVKPSEDDRPLPSAGLYVRWMSRQEYSATLAVLFPGHVNELVERGVITQPDLERSYPKRRFGFAHKSLGPLAAALADQLRGAGRELRVLTKPSQRGHVDLWVGPALPEGKQVENGYYFPLTTGSPYLRGVDRQPSPDAADSATFLRWPPRLRK